MFKIEKEERFISEKEKQQSIKNILQKIDTFKTLLNLPPFSKKTLKFSKADLAFVYTNFENFCEEAYSTLKELLKSNEVYSNIAFKLATNPPSVNKNELKQLM